MLSLCPLMHICILQNYIHAQKKILHIPQEPAAVNQS